MKLTLGDKFIVNGEERILTEMAYAEDGLGIYSMYPHLDGCFNTLIGFVTKVREGEITKVPLTIPRNVMKLTI